VVGEVSPGLQATDALQSLGLISHYCGLIQRKVKEWSVERMERRKRGVEGWKSRSRRTELNTVGCKAKGKVPRVIHFVLPAHSTSSYIMRHASWTHAHTRSTSILNTADSRRATWLTVDLYDEDCQNMDACSSRLNVGT
jgi:hypothetical protein